MKTDSSAILELLGVTPQMAIGGFFGALLSLRFSDAATRQARLIEGLSSWIASMCLTPIVMAVFQVSPVVQFGGSFLVGLYGWLAIGEGQKFIKSGALQDWIRVMTHTQKND